MAEIEPCPLCGALPCDWADNPHVARPSPARDEVLEEALRVAEVTIRLDAQRLQEAGRTTLQADAALAQIDAALKAQHPFTGGGDIPEGMVPWHGGDGPPPDWDHEGLVKLRSGLTMRQAEQMSPLEWAWRGGKWAHGDIIAYTPRPSTVREDETARLMHVIDRDRYAAAIVLNNIKKVLAGYSWLSEAGRGSYAYDDERYQREFGDALEAIEAALTPLGRLAFDKTDCTTDPDKVHAARQAGVERAVHLAS